MEKPCRGHSGAPGRALETYPTAGTEKRAGHIVVRPALFPLHRKSLESNVGTSGSIPDMIRPRMATSQPCPRPASRTAWDRAGNTARDGTEMPQNVAIIERCACGQPVCITVGTHGGIAAVPTQEVQAVAIIGYRTDPQPTIPRTGTLRTVDQKRSSVESRPAVSWLLGTSAGACARLHEPKRFRSCRCVLQAAPGQRSRDRQFVRERSGTGHA